MTLAVPVASLAGLGSVASPTPLPVGNPGDNPNHIGPGPIAFWIVVGLGVALFFLVRSMGHQMRKVRFDDGSDESAPAGGPGPAASGSVASGSGDADATRIHDRHDTIPAVPPIRPDVPVALRRPPRRR